MLLVASTSSFSEFFSAACSLLISRHELLESTIKKTRKPFVPDEVWTQLLPAAPHADHDTLQGSDRKGRRGKRGRKLATVPTSREGAVKKIKQGTEKAAPR